MQPRRGQRSRQVVPGTAFAAFPFLFSEPLLLPLPASAASPPPRPKQPNSIVLISVRYCLLSCCRCSCARVQLLMISSSLFSQAVFLAQRIWLDAFLIWFDTRCVCRGVFIRLCFKHEIPNLKYLSSPLKRVPMAVLHAESISCTYSGQG